MRACFSFRADARTQEFCRPRFLGQAAPIEVDKKKYDLMLWNTANHEDYTRIRHLVYMNVDVLLVCFAVDDPESFSNAIDKVRESVLYSSVPPR